MANFPPSEKQKNGYKTNHKLEIQLQILSMPVMTYKKFKSSWSHESHSLLIQWDLNFWKFRLLSLHLSRNKNN